MDMTPFGAYQGVFGADIKSLMKMIKVVPDKYSECQKQNNMNDVCEACKDRFTCWTTRPGDTIEIDASAITSSGGMFGL